MDSKNFINKALDSTEMLGLTSFVREVNYPFDPLKVNPIAECDDSFTSDKPSKKCWKVCKQHLVNFVRLVNVYHEYEQEYGKKYNGHTTTDIVAYSKKTVCSECDGDIYDNHLVHCANCANCGGRLTSKKVCNKLKCKLAVQKRKTFACRGCRIKYCEECGSDGYCTKCLRKHSDELDWKCDDNDHYIEEEIEEESSGECEKCGNSTCDSCTICSVDLCCKHKKIATCDGCGEDIGTVCGKSECTDKIFELHECSDLCEQLEGKKIVRANKDIDLQFDKCKRVVCDSCTICAIKLCDKHKWTVTCGECEEKIGTGCGDNCMDVINKSHNCAKAKSPEKRDDAEDVEEISSEEDKLETPKKIPLNETCSRCEKVGTKTCESCKTKMCGAHARIFLHCATKDCRRCINVVSCINDECEKECAKIHHNFCNGCEGIFCYKCMDPGDKCKKCAIKIEGKCYVCEKLTVSTAVCYMCQIKYYICKSHKGNEIVWKCEPCGGDVFCACGRKITCKCWVCGDSKCIVCSEDILCPRCSVSISGAGICKKGDCKEKLLELNTSVCKKCNKRYCDTCVNPTKKICLDCMECDICGTKGTKFVKCKECKKEYSACEKCRKKIKKHNCDTCRKKSVVECYSCNNAATKKCVVCDNNMCDKDSKIVPDCGCSGIVKYVCKNQYCVDKITSRNKGCEMCGKSYCTKCMKVITFSCPDCYSSLKIGCKSICSRKECKEKVISEFTKKCENCDKPNKICKKHKNPTYQISCKKCGEEYTICKICSPKLLCITCGTSKYSKVHKSISDESSDEN